MSRSRIAREFCLVTRWRMRVEDMLVFLVKESKLREERARTWADSGSRLDKNACCTLSPKCLVKNTTDRQSPCFSLNLMPPQP